DRVSAKAVDIHSPCITRSTVKVVRSGATASNAVGIESKVRLTRIARRRSMRLLKNATASPATAMPMVLALTAKPMAAGVTLYALASDGRIAWVAKRSAWVRKAGRPLTKESNGAAGG